MNEGATGKECRQPLKLGNSFTDSQQGNSDLNPTVTRKGTLATKLMSKETDHPSEPAETNTTLPILTV